jgi:outer membrane protein TolC
MRPDLKRLRSEEAAQHQSLSIAKSSFGPRVNAFAGWEADNPTFVAGGGGNNWLAGIEVQFDLFEGGAKRARLPMSAQYRKKLRKGKGTRHRRDSARSAPRYYDLTPPASRSKWLALRLRSLRKACVSIRTATDSGLSTITDLLAAEEAARRSQTGSWEGSIAITPKLHANLELASRTLNPQSPVVTP